METAILNSKIKSIKQSGAYKIMLLFAFILHIGVFIYFMINTPVHTDEVMTVLNANSLAKSGTDIEALLYKAGYFNNNDFSNLPKFTKDNSIEFKNPKEKIIEDYVIVYSPQLKNLKYDKNQYEIIDFGSFVVLNKK